MTLRQVAELLPDKYREHLLTDNVIYKAIARQGDPHMKMLLIYWHNYIDPTAPVDEQCNICLNNILEKFKALQPHFIEIEKDYQLLQL